MSVVVPVYKNAATLEPLYQRLRSVLEATDRAWEILFVNDACPEGSGKILRRLARQDPRVAALSLEANAGQARAIWTGLHFARGEWVVIMDADLQDPPEAIPLLLERATREQEPIDVVFAGRRKRYEAWGRWLSGWLFRRLRGWLCGIPGDAGGFGVLRREAVRAVVARDLPNPQWSIIVGCAGLSSISLPVPRAVRPVGRSAYTHRMRWRLAWETLRSILRLRWQPARWTRSEGEICFPKGVQPIGARFDAEGS